MFDRVVQDEWFDKAVIGETLRLRENWTSLLLSPIHPWWSGTILLKQDILPSTLRLGWKQSFAVTMSNWRCCCLPPQILKPNPLFQGCPLTSFPWYFCEEDGWKESSLPVVSLIVHSWGTDRRHASAWMHCLPLSYPAFIQTGESTWTWMSTGFV